MTANTFEHTSFLAQSGAGSPASEHPAVRIFTGMDWTWVGYFAIVAAIVFGCLLFGMIFVRRWREPRLGFFLFTISTFVVRVLRPGDFFWNVAALAGAVGAAIMTVITIRDIRNHDIREVVYYLLNGFTLLLITPAIQNIYISLCAGVSLIASLFFMLTTRAASGRYRGRDADPHILESLQKRAGRKL